MSVNVNAGLKTDFYPIDKEKNVKSSESNEKSVSSSKCGPATKCINIKDELSINRILPGGCIKPGWDPTGGFEDIFAMDKQVTAAKKQVKNILNADTKAETAGAVKEFYQNIDTMDRGELLEVADFLNEMIKSNPKQADVLTGLMNGVLEELKQKENTWHKLPWGPIPCGPGPKTPIDIFPIDKLPIDIKPNGKSPEWRSPIGKFPSYDVYPNEKKPSIDSFPNEKLPSLDKKIPFDIIKPKFDYPPGDYPINKKEDFMFAKN